MTQAPEQPLQVYVRLLGEGTTVYRPAFAMPTGTNTARLLMPSGFDPDDEHWEFQPGTLVSLERRRLSGGEVLVAVAAALP